MKLQTKAHTKDGIAVVVWKKGQACQGRATSNWLKASRSQDALIWFRREAKP